MIDKQIYMWPQVGNVTPKLGKKVASNNPSEIWREAHVLMMPLYGTVAEWVMYMNLKPYPSEPIPTP